MKVLLLLIFQFAYFVPTQADVRIGFESNFVFDNQSISSNSNASTTLVDGFLGLNFSRDSGLYLTVGGLYTQREIAVSETETGTLTGLNPYAGFTYGFCGRKQICAIGIYVAPLVQATYAETGTETEKWQGTATYGKISLRPQLTNSLFLAASIAFYSASYSTKGTNASVSAVESFQSTTVFPMIGLQYLWDSP